MACPPRKKPLYRVRFTMSEIWGDGAERPDDTIDAEFTATGWKGWIPMPHDHIMTTTTISTTKG